MNLRAHLARVDRKSVAYDLAVTIVSAVTAATFAAEDRTGWPETRNWFFTAVVSAAAAIATVHLSSALWETFRPESLAQKAKDRQYEDRIAELDDELDATLGALRESEANVDRLTNERDDARAELDDLRADRDGLLTERDEILAETGHAVTKLAELSADLWDDPAPEPDSRYVSDAVTSFNRSARDTFLAMGPPPGYGQDGEAK